MLHFGPNHCTKLCISGVYVYIIVLAYMLIDTYLIDKHANRISICANRNSICANRISIYVNSIYANIISIYHNVLWIMYSYTIYSGNIISGNIYIYIYYTLLGLLYTWGHNCS